MKKVTGIITLGIALIFQSCDSNNATLTKTRVKTMLLKVNGEISVKPDNANITVYLKCTDMDIRKSKKCLINKSEVLNNDFAKYGIKEEDILTTAISQSKTYKWQKRSNVFVGYSSSITTHLTIKNMKILEDIYTDLLSNENISIGGLSYYHSNTDSLERCAYQAALNNANLLSDKLLDNMKESKKEILRIGNVDLPAAQAVYDYENDKKLETLEYSENVAKSKIRINNGTVYVNKTLVVEYGVK